MHVQQFKEMLRTAKALPASNWPKPSEVLALEWFCMSFHINDRNKFVTVGKKLETKTFESVTNFFEAHFNQNKNDNTLERMELKRIKKCAHLKLKCKLYDKICTCKDKCRTYQANCKLVSCNAQCRPYDNRNERHWYIDHDRNCDCAYGNKR